MQHDKDLVIVEWTKNGIKSHKQSISDLIRKKTKVVYAELNINGENHYISRVELDSLRNNILT